VRLRLINGPSQSSRRLRSGDVSDLLLLQHGAEVCQHPELPQDHRARRVAVEQLDPAVPEAEAFAERSLGFDPVDVDQRADREAIGLLGRVTSVWIIVPRAPAPR
jgi:hypothetical protein